VCGHRQQPQPHMGTAFTPAKTSPASWDAFNDVDAFVDAVLAELAAMAGTRPTRSGPPLTGAALRKAILAIWCVAFCGMQHRPAVRHSVRHALHAVRPRLGLWRRLLNRLILSWRQACGDKPVPSAVIVDSVVQRRLASGAASMAARRSRASRSISRLISTASRWRSMSRRPTGMTARASFQYCISLPASKEQPWAISATGVSGCPRGARHYHRAQRRRRNLHSGGDSVGG
jgi:hypothetical protein